ncbi:hypothetical protein GQ457_07G010570 [Hibiscus cannabinus]
MIKRYYWKLFVLFRFYARNDQPGRIKPQQYFEVVLKQLGSQRPRNHQGRVSAGPVVSSQDIPFVIQPKQNIETPR